MNPLVFVVASVLLAAGLAAVEHSDLEPKVLARRVTGVLGGIVALVLINSGREDIAWRSVDLGPDESLICGVALLAFWALIGLGFGSHTASDGLVAVSTAPLILAVGAEWIVPHLLFLACVWLPVISERLRNGGRSAESLAIGVAFAAISGGLVLAWMNAERWQMPTSAGAPERWILLAGVALAVAAPSAFTARRVTLGAPLLAAAGFSLVPPLADGAPYTGVAVLGAALAVGGVAALRRSPEWAASSVPLLVLLGSGLLAPGAFTAAGVGAVLIASTSAAGRAQGDPFRAALVGLAPLSVAFAGFSLALERALTAASRPGAERIGWALAAGGLLLGLGACLRLAVARGRSAIPEAPGQIKQSVLAMGVGLVLLAAAEPLTGALPLGSGGGAVLLILLAGAAGTAATVALAQREPVTIPSDPASSEQVPIEEPANAPRWVSVGAMAVGLASLLAVGWLTVQGLRVGFL